MMHTWQVILILWLAYAAVLTFMLYRPALLPRKSSPTARGWGNRGRLLIIGASGGTGRELVRQALEQGHEVTAFVRNPKRLPVEHPNLRVVRGDVLDYASLEPAMRGQNVVLSALGHTRFFYPTRILSEGTSNILRAMKKCDVPRFICETSLGVGDAAGRLGLLHTLSFVPLLLHFYFWDRVRQEQLIAGSEVDWIIVRPSMLTNGPARGQYRHGNVGSYLRPTRVSRADVAAFMLAQMDSDTCVGAAPGICY